MNDRTRLDANIALQGLLFVADVIDEALFGEKRQMNIEKAKLGPFVETLARVGDIADGESVPNIEGARVDLLFLFKFLHHLQGQFYSSLWRIVASAHEKVADVIAESEARALLEQHGLWLHLDAKLGHIHCLEEDESGLHTYDATFLGMPPLGKVWYAKYEIEARKKVYDSIYVQRNDSTAKR